MQADPNKKNTERMEERVPDADEQQLQQMLTDSPWEHQAVMDQVALEADCWLGGDANSCLLIDESGCKKAGKHSVGVARQWCGRLGKVDNCQVGVFAALGRDRSVTLVDGRLYLPEKWCEDAKRCEQAGIPEANAPAIRVDQWQAEQPAAAWQRLKVRDSTRGELEVLAQMEKRHKKRFASMRAEYAKQGIALLE